MKATSNDRAWAAVAVQRLALGFTQGLSLWLLGRAAHDAWAVHGGLWAALLLVTVFVPLIPMAGLGRMRLRTLLPWTAAAALLIVTLTFYDAWRNVPDGDSAVTAAAGPSAQLVFFAGAALYILHHLIEPADAARRWWPAYAAYVDSAWRHAFQLASSLAFALVLWGVLSLGGRLFEAIGVTTLASALHSGALVWPVLGLAFAYAIHRTDINPQMMMSVRNLGLTLLASLLLVATLLVGAFLTSLLFTGLEPLWNTRQSARLLLIAATTLVVLINAAYQDGRQLAATALLWAGRIASLLLPLLVALAAWSLALRVRQYGLTPERAGGFATCVIAAVYGCGYAWAALARGPWMRPLERVNVIAAITGVVLIVAVLSPIADPARLATDDQLARLESGSLPIARFDFAALRFKTARYGRDALATLTRSNDPAIADRARTAQTLAYYGETSDSRVTGEPFSRARVRPLTSMLPKEFRTQQWPLDNLHWNAGRCLISDAPCDLFVVDLDGDDNAEIVAMSEQGDGAPVVFVRRHDGVWRIAGSFVGRYTDSAALAAIAAGQIKPTAPLMPDLSAGRLRLRFEPDDAYQDLIDNPPTTNPGN